MGRSGDCPQGRAGSMGEGLSRHPQERRRSTVEVLLSLIQGQQIFLDFFFCSKDVLPLTALTKSSSLSLMAPLPCSISVG